MSQPVEKLEKNDYAIVKLIIVDEHNNPIKKPYKLAQGANVFRCMAVYNDGSKEPYNPYWMCPIVLNKSYPDRGVELDVWGVLGQDKRAEAVINAAPNHERYTELACWVFPPKKETQTGNAEIPHDSTGFDYSNIPKAAN